MTDGLAPRSLELWPDAALITDADGRLREVNDALATMFGYDRDALVGQHVECLLPDRLADAHREHRERFARAPGRRPMGAGRVLTGRRADGTELPVEISLSPVASDIGPLVIATVREVTRPPATEPLTEPDDARYRSIFEDSPIGMAMVDSDGRIRAANRALLDLLDAVPHDLVGRTIDELGEHEHEHEHEHQSAADSDTRSGHTRRFARADGSFRWALLSTVPMRDTGAGGASIVIVQDVTDTIVERRRLAHLATHDELTGLPTRVLLWERLEQALARAARTGDAVAVLYLDLDGFKRINDTFGHRVGDAVLQEVARRLQLTVRPSDTAARVGGDEFVVCCDGLPPRPVVAWGLVQALTTRLRAAFDAPITVDVGGGEAKLAIGVSIGAAVGVGATRSADALVWEADAAMFREKATHRRAVDADTEPITEPITEPDS